jgi:hypothetical protein
LDGRLAGSLIRISTVYKKNCGGQGKSLPTAVFLSFPKKETGAGLFFVYGSG